jgi:hypothetical protein
MSLGMQEVATAIEQFAGETSKAVRAARAGAQAARLP